MTVTAALCYLSVMLQVLFCVLLIVGDKTEKEWLYNIGYIGVIPSNVMGWIMVALMFAQRQGTA